MAKEDKETFFTLLGYGEPFYISVYSQSIYKEVFTLSVYSQRANPIL